MVTLNEQYLTNIANAIREKNRTSTQYTPDQMATKICDLLVVDRVAAPSPNTTVQVCDNTSGTKAKSFTVSLTVSNANEYSPLTIFFAEALDGTTQTGTSVALIRKSFNAIISHIESGEFQAGTKGGSSTMPTYNAIISVPAGASRTVTVTGYQLKYR